METCRRRDLDPLAIGRGFARLRPCLLQLRAKTLTDADRYDLARRLAPICREAGVPLLINDRPDIARLADADGVHLGRDDLPPRAVRELLGPRALLGLSTHDAAQVDAARDEPVHYLGFGPIFPTATKRNPDPVVGLEGLRIAVCRSAHPVVAIGGISLERLAEVRAAGAQAAALVSSLLADDPPARLADALRRWHAGAPR